MIRQKNDGSNLDIKQAIQKTWYFTLGHRTVIFLTAALLSRMAKKKKKKEEEGAKSCLRTVVSEEKILLETMTLSVCLDSIFQLMWL